MSLDCVCRPRFLHCPAGVSRLSLVSLGANPAVGRCSPWSMGGAAAAFYPASGWCHLYDQCALAELNRTNEQGQKVPRANSCGTSQCVWWFDRTQFIRLDPHHVPTENLLGDFVVSTCHTGPRQNPAFHVASNSAVLLRRLHGDGEHRCQPRPRGGGCACACMVQEKDI